MTTSICIGLSFGDEGKGLTTSYLVQQCKAPSHKCLVVRFNGGHQAGHSVNFEGKRHTFSSFGSGTLQGASTFWSRFCTFSPSSFLKEHAVLFEFWDLDLIKAPPLVYVDAMCPVVTPYDMEFNRLLAGANRHGSCGVGYGTTLQRQEDHFKLHVNDLPYPSVIDEKLRNMERYYSGRITKIASMFSAYPNEFLEATINKIKQALPEYKAHIKKIVEDGLIKITNDISYVIAREKYEDIVFEGAQGILLDEDFGFFPNVTRGYTTSRNALQLIKELELPKPEIYYVTRCYQTRHGNGYMSNVNKPVALVNNEKENNVTNKWQGDFKTGVLDVDLLNYALDCDNNYSHGLTKKLVVTCCDQMDVQKGFPVTINGEQREITIDVLQVKLNHPVEMLVSDGDSCDHVHKLTEWKSSEIFIEENAGT